MAVAGAVLGVAQLGYGIFKSSQASNEADKALAKRRQYQTPAEYYKILQATQNAAQSGLDPTTLQYYNNTIDQTFSSALNTSEQLGADPNDLSALFDKKVQAMMQIGAEDHRINTENFSRYLSAADMIAKSKDAEFFSGQDLIKDQQQKAAVDKQNATGQINAGFNTLVSTAANYATNKLYKEQTDKAIAAAAETGAAVTISAPPAAVVPATAPVAATPTTNSTDSTSTTGYFDTTTNKWRKWDGSEWIRKT